MKRRIYIFFTFCVCALLCGCGMIHWGEQYSESLIHCYYVINHVEDVEIQPYPDNRFDISLPLKYYAIRQHNDETYVERHKELSSRYGDIGLNSWVAEDLWFVHDSWAFPLSEFTIVSDVDFDMEHPTGTLLNDIVEIRYRTMKYFIENNYNRKNKDSALNIPIEGEEVVKRVSELEPQDAIFMDPRSMQISFMSQPTINKEHNISVRVTLEGYLPYKFTFEANFAE